MRLSFRQHPYLASFAVLAALAGVGCVWIARSPQPFAEAWLRSVTIDRRIDPLSPGLLRWVSRGFAALAVCFAVVAGTIAAFGARLSVRFRSDPVPAAAAEIPASTRTHRFMVVAAILAGAVYRSGFLTQPVGFDEAISYVFFASRGFIDALTDYAIPNNHILHTLFMHVTHAAGARTAAMLRMPAFSAGVLAIPTAYWLAQRLWGRPDIAVGTAWLVAVAPPVVEYSAQARGYTLGGLLFLLAFIAATFTQQRGVLAWLAFVLLSALALFTIPTMLLGFGIPCLWLMFVAKKSQRLGTALKIAGAGAATGLFTLLLYAPAIFRSGLESLTSNSYVAPLAVSSLPQAVWTSAGRTAGCWTGSLPFVGSIGIWLLALVPLFGPRELRRKALQIGPAIIICLLFFIVWRRIAPPPRTINFLYPLFAMFVATGAHVLSLRLNSRTIWFTGIVAFSTIWAALRISAGGFGWQRESPPLDPRVRGPFAANACAEGYYVDAAAIVDRFAPDIKRGALLVAYVYSGAVETVQFELVRRGLPPTSARPIRDRDSIPRIADARDVLVLLMPIAGGPVLHTPYDLLHTDSAGLSQNFSTPLLVEAFAVTRVYRIKQLNPPDTVRLRRIITYPR